MENKTIEKIVKNNYDFVNKTKNYYQAKKRKKQKRLREYYKNLSEEEKLNTEITLTTEIKIC